MKYIKNIAMLLAAFFAVVTVSCTDDETADSGVADRLFRPVSVTLTPKGTSLTASWTGIKGAAGYWVELYTMSKVAGPDETELNDYHLVASNEMTTATTWVVDGLEYNTTYYFRVKAIDPDMARNSYFSDFYSVKVPAMTEVLSCELLEPVSALVRFSWMEGYGIEFVKITAPDGGVRTVYVDDADGSFEMDGFASGTYTAVAGNSSQTYNTVEFIVPVLYDVEASDITFDNIRFTWRVDADIRAIICTNAADPTNVVTFDLGSEAINAGTYDYAVAEGRLKYDATYTAVLRYADETLSNVVTFTTMKEKPAGAVFVSTIDELLAAVSGGEQIVALQPGEYLAEENIVLTRAITFMAATRQMPKVIVNQFTVSPTAYLDGVIRFEAIEFECKNLNNTTSCFIDNTNMKANIRRIEVEDCYIHDYGSSFMRFNRTNDITVEEILVNNNRLLRMYGQNSFLQLSKGTLREITFTNNTMTGLDTQNAGVRFISYNAGDQTRAVFNNNTFTDYHNKGRLFFHINSKEDGAESAGSVEIKNNIFYTEEAEYCNVSNFDKYVLTVTIENNVVTKPWGNGGDSAAPASEPLTSWGEKYSELDPVFKNAAKYDFTVTNDEVVKLGVGDPRWLK